MTHTILTKSFTVFIASFVSFGSVAASPLMPPAQVAPVSPTPPTTSGATTVVVTAQSATDTPEVKGQSDMNRVICRTRPVLGSRLSKQRECRTAAQWEAIRQQASKGADGATRAMTKGMVRPGS